MITLTLSSDPATNNIPIESQRAVDKPKTIVAIPNPVTHQRSVLPASPIGGGYRRIRAFRKRRSAGPPAIKRSPTEPQAGVDPEKTVNKQPRPLSARAKGRTLSAP